MKTHIETCPCCHGVVLGKLCPIGKRLAFIALEIRL